MLPSDVNEVCQNFLKKHVIQNFTHDNPFRMCVCSCHICHLGICQKCMLCHIFVMKWNFQTNSQIYIFRRIKRYFGKHCLWIIRDFGPNFLTFGFPKMFGKLTSLPVFNPPSILVDINCTANKSILEDINLLAGSHASYVKLEWSVGGLHALIEHGGMLTTCFHSAY